VGLARSALGVSGSMCFASNEFDEPMQFPRDRSRRGTAIALATGVTGIYGPEKEAAVKYMKVFRSPMLLVGLVAPLFFALPSRAQQEVDPDHFESGAVQSAPLAKAAPLRKHRQIAAARARGAGAARTSANGLVASGANGSTGLQPSGQSLNNARATDSRRASAQDRARKDRKLVSVADNE